MKLTQKHIKKGFVLAGLMNIGGVLIFSRFFTNTVIPETDPTVMSHFGLLMIVVWGIAFLAMSQKYKPLKWLIGVFIIEKLIYGVTWTLWMIKNDLAAVYQKDVMAGIFYTIYGINDWIFFLFFGIVFIKLSKSPQSNSLIN
ncbi:hypothetical protein [Flavobacterium tegetincola]|uniref:hypothetical protein n=1 Tax=Flavobacterium tegetincola TaxID=150172 RepID=UPI00040B990D|nr:hypothetical protein [Flavobacterium tegetincola]